MALSIEAALVVPICLIAFSSVLSKAVPAYMQVNTTAILSAEAVMASCANSSIYMSRSVEYRSSHMTAVSTCPDGIIDMYRLGKDILRPLGELFDEEVKSNE